MHDRILGISGCAKDSRPGLPSADFVGKLAAGYAAGHDDIGEQQIEGLTAFHIFERRTPIGGCGRAIAQVMQLRDHEAAHQSVILHYQDGFAGASGWLNHRNERFSPSAGCGQVQLDRRAVAFLAVDLDVPA